MAAVDLVVSRAGAITLAEVCAAGRPSVLLPLLAGGAHQLANARLLFEAGAASLIEDDLLDADRLRLELTNLLGDRALLARMGENARSLARPQAAWDVASTAFAAAFAGRTVSYERRLTHQGASARWTRAMVFPDRDAQGEVEAIYTIAFDIHDDVASAVVEAQRARASAGDEQTAPGSPPSHTAATPPGVAPPPGEVGR